MTKAVVNLSRSFDTVMSPSLFFFFPPPSVTISLGDIGSKLSFDLAVYFLGEIRSKQQQKKNPDNQ